MAQDCVAEGLQTIFDDAPMAQCRVYRSGVNRRSLYAISRRSIDLVVSVFLLVVLCLPMTLVAVLVRLTSSGPALFRQVRVGRDCQPFVMLKFRSMQQDADDQVHRTFVSAMLRREVERSSNGCKGMHKLTDDERVTRLGGLLRRTSFDELPQLINVIIGDMSLVGPRPSLPWEVDLFGPSCRARFDVKPGLTGLWQVSGRSNMTMQEALELDVRYARECSLRLDLAILARTVPVVLSCRGAS
jgi:lipopolysaccharide/colanic/teichoic acid biosynthesis glycosyltransferase